MLQVVLKPSALDSPVCYRTACSPSVLPFPAAVAGPRMPAAVAFADDTRSPALCDTLPNLVV